MQIVMHSVEVIRHHFNMASYGGLTQKPTWLWSNRPWIKDVEDYTIQDWRVAKPVSLVEVWSTDGRRKFRGNSSTKSSQEYPQALASPWL
jgi:hypothetical protein